MASWDVFHAESLELERDLSGDAIRAARAAGTLHDDDLIRPAGTTVAWARLGDSPELSAPDSPPVPIPMATTAPVVPEAPEPDATTRRQPPPAKPCDPPARIRAGRVDAPLVPAEPSDFEVRAEPIGSDSLPEMPVAPASIAVPPAWVELGGEPDDVTFPVLDEPPADRPPSRSPAPAWDWPEDDEDEDEPDDQIEILDDNEAREILDEDGLGVPSPHSRESAGRNGSSSISLPVVPSRDWNEDRPPVVDHAGEDEDFSLSRGGPTTVEELDLAPMVDVAFQLVLFFMVTATTVLYKTLEIPKPTPEQPPSAMAQGNSTRSMDDLKKDYVVVEIDSTGAIQIDSEPVAADVDAMAERLRTAREKTGRKIMLLSADYTTPHRNAVLAYDAAIEIGMGIAIAKPTTPQGPAPSVFPGPAGASKAPGGTVTSR